MQSEHLEWHAATVRRHRDLSPTVCEIELQPDDGVRPWRVGSHLNVQVRLAAGTETRSYSLVGLPHDPDARAVYRIAVKRMQPSRGGSRHLWSLAPGDALRVGTPSNHFEMPLDATQYLLVAGGIGITPLVGMALQLAQRGADLRMRYAARSDDELVFADVLRSALGARLQTFADSAGARLDLDAEIGALHPKALLLACGPVPLLDALSAAWARAGRSPVDLRFETFGNSGAQANEAFRVRLPRHGLELEVPADRSLLDVLNSAGVATLSDCGRGECGLCALDVVSVQGRIDHRDVFFSAAEKRTNRRLCACVSRVVGGALVLDSAYRPD
ncbi:MAG: PDR/VanB family oxidoreductase [Burkholderiaceae bacterium]